MTTILSWGRIDKELEEAINSLSETEKVEFDKLEKERIQAIAFVEPHKGLDGYFWWTDLEIYNDPFIISEESYTPLNPHNKNNKFRKTKILTFDDINIAKSREIKRWGGIFNALFKKKKPERFYEYWIHNQTNPKGVEKVISYQERVIPIYQNNLDYQRIMEFIREKREE